MHDFQSLTICPHWSGYSEGFDVGYVLVFLILGYTLRVQKMRASRKVASFEMLMSFLDNFFFSFASICLKHFYQFIVLVVTFIFSNKLFKTCQRE